MKTRLTIQRAEAGVSVISRLKSAEARLDNIERRQNKADGKLDTICRDISAIRAESNVRATLTTACMDRLSYQIADLAKEMASQTGAQQERNRINEERLRLENIRRIKAETRLANWKRHLAGISLVIMLFGSVSSAFLSWQDISGYLWAEIFHQQKPGGPHAA